MMQIFVVRRQSGNSHAWLAASQPHSERKHTITIAIAAENYVRVFGQEIARYKIEPLKRNRTWRLRGRHVNIVCLVFGYAIY